MSSSSQLSSTEMTGFSYFTALPGISPACPHDSKRFCQTAEIDLGAILNILYDSNH